MANLWIDALFFTAQIAGAIIWIPIILTILGMAGIFIMNTFILGGKFEKKADVNAVVLLKQYEKDVADISREVDKKVNADILKTYTAVLHERMDKIEAFRDESNRHYINISGQLGSINTSIRSIEKNCEKQTCKK